MFVKTEDGNVRDVELSQVTKENYIVPEGEQGFYHVVMEVKQYDPKNGAKISTPRVQKFNPQTFKKLKDNFERQGYTMVILYDPTEYIKTKGETLAKQKANAEKERIDAAVKSALAAQEKTMQERIDAAVKAALAEKKTKKTE